MTPPRARLVARNHRRSSSTSCARLAAKEMLAVALLAERRAYLDAHATELDATGRRLVVANGYARPREVVTGAGAVEVTAPRVDDRRER